MLPSYWPLMPFWVFCQGTVWYCILSRPSENSVTSKLAVGEPAVAPKCARSDHSMVKLKAKGVLGQCAHRRRS